jgi:1,4-dihydroxy-2-naphthoyl-CoA synthase
MSDFKYIKTSNQNQTLEITISRPEVYNALNVDAKMELIQAIRMAGRS